MNREMVIVLDFGGQYNQLIARRVRECSVYCEVHPYTLSLEKIKEMNPKGIIFTGGPNSVYDETSPHYQKEIFELGIPILGICYGSPADGIHPGRRGKDRPGQRVRQNRDYGGPLQRPVPGCGGKYGGLDEPYRLHREGTRGLPRHGAHAGLPCGGHGVPRKKALRGTVPS